jgi:hypothetical protein
VRELLRNAVLNEPQKTASLGKRLRALFSELGPEEDVSGWRGRPVKPATFS